MNITLTLRGDALNRLVEWPGASMCAIARGQDEATKEITSRTISTRLTGKGPFPPSEHRLGRVTHDLATTTVAVPPVISGNIVTTAITSSAWYWELHEMGWHGEVRSSGSHIRRQASRNLPGKGKRLRGSGIAFVQSHTLFHHRDIPARAPVQTGIAENLDLIYEKVGEQLSYDWGGTLSI